MRGPFAYYGGKAGLADELVRLLPESQVYVEVFAGGGSVLFARPPRPGRVDVLNDVDDAVVTFFRVLRDRPADLERALQLTPYSRREFELAVAGVDEPGLDELERARRFFVRVSQAFAGSPRQSGWSGQRLGGSRVSRPIAIRDNVDRLPAIAERLRTVQVEALDWRACLERYDAPTVTFYLDPPYVHETRGNGGGGVAAYRHELELAEHAELVERLLELDGSWVLSGYAHDVYAPLEQVAERFEFGVRSTASASNVKAATEVVWRRIAVGVHVQERLAV